MKQIWNQTAEELKQKFGVREDGLTTAEVERIRMEKGENVLEEGKKKSVLQVFLEQFCDLLVIILMIAASISFVSGNTESTIVILLVLIMNAILGTAQHVKAEKSLESLKQLSSPNAKVMRNGTVIEIPSREVVPGDIVMLEAGDMIVADGRILNLLADGRLVNLAAGNGHPAEIMDMSFGIQALCLEYLVKHGKNKQK